LCGTLGLRAGQQIRPQSAAGDNYPKKNRDNRPSKKRTFEAAAVEDGLVLDYSDGHLFQA
jgi:hypothetical protein